MIARWTVLFLFLIAGVNLFGQPRLLDLDRANQREMQEYVQGFDVITIGEMHGTREIPEVTFRIAEMMSGKGKHFTVALELHSSMQDAMNAFVRNGDVTGLLSHDYFEMADGRTSQAMLQLLGKLRGLPGISILCFDIPAGRGDVNRDSLMGVNLSNGYRTEKMLVLTGNLHIPSSINSRSANAALTWFMKSRKITPLILETFFNDGTIWNCMADGCKERMAYSNPGIVPPQGLKNFICISPASPGTSSYPGAYIYFQKVTASEPFTD